MAGEAGAEIPAPAAPPLPVPEKRVVREEDGGEGEVERHEPKRRRPSVAALDGVSCAVAPVDNGEAEEEDGHVDEGSFFSFQHARGGFGALETTPKFGSFHPPAPLAEQGTLDPKLAPPAAEDPPLVEEEEEDAASARGVGDGEGGNSQLVAAVGDQEQPVGQNESE
ncbi:uncharacterized protein LOC100829698 [Brachypodium distachyon]|uniref:Uncharacterized protein n=1 Tax=Brachypodium distachyon TaxID=15368 RepID=I1HSK0_BRADI|nr:uncharacterized protein LOC100829698 [Brachypodium distachyon]KQK10199.1 hypothetical protein BRADI_2g52620v3 [Brachypodium distachyon]|eukprot:XP_003567207.1 uncharacterized protein LOC100829698 [Brachypodium distachyon]